MKKSLFLLAFFAIRLIVIAQTNVSVTPSFVSSYVFRGQQITGAAYQPSIEIDRGNLAVGVWASTPLRTLANPEVDYYASYADTINDAIAITPGVTVYSYPRAKTDDGAYRATIEPSLALTYSRWGFKATPKAYYDTVLHAATGELTLTRSIPLFSTELDLTAQGGQYRILDTTRDASPRVKSWGDYYLVGFSVPFTLKATKIAWGYAYTGGYMASKEGSAPKDDSRAGRGVITVNLSWTF